MQPKRARLAEAARQGAHCSATSSMRACGGASSSSGPEDSNSSTLLALPACILEAIAGRLDSGALACLNQCSKAFRTYCPRTGLRLVDKTARDILVAGLGEQQAQRWRCVGAQRGPGHRLDRASGPRPRAAAARRGAPGGQLRGR